MLRWLYIIVAAIIALGSYATALSAYREGDRSLWASTQAGGSWTALGSGLLWGTLAMLLLLEKV